MGKYLAFSICLVNWGGWQRRYCGRAQKSLHPDPGQRFFLNRRCRAGYTSPKNLAGRFQVLDQATHHFGPGLILLQCDTVGLVEYNCRANPALGCLLGFEPSQTFFLYRGPALLGWNVSQPFFNGMCEQACDGTSPLCLQLPQENLPAKILLPWIYIDKL